MKNKIIISGLALVMLGIAPMGFAASFGKSGGQPYMVVEGTVVSVNKAKNIFAIKDRDDGKTYGLSAFASDIASLNQGGNARVTVPLPGSLASKISQ